MPSPRALSLPLTGPRLIVAGLLSTAAVVAVAEVLHQRAGRSAVASGAGSTVVVVLGYPTRRNGRPHPIQRWRVRLGVRAMRATKATKIIFSGGSPANAFPEAETMADLARAAGVPETAIQTETESESTWQNVAYTAPLTDAFDRVVVASDPLHAKRARNYWIQQRPSDADRVFVSDSRRPFEGTWSSVPTAAIEIIRTLRGRALSAVRR